MCTGVCIYVRIYLCIDVCIDVRIYVCIDVRIYVCIDVCIDVCTLQGRELTVVLGTGESVDRGTHALSGKVSAF